MAPGFQVKPGADESQLGRAWTLDGILNAVRKVETGGARDEGRQADGDGGLAIGPFQIHRAYWQDAGLPGTFDDCRDSEYAQSVVLAYWRRYCPKALSELNAEVLARIHNGGPTGNRKEATRKFWRKVEMVLDANRTDFDESAIHPSR